MSKGGGKDRGKNDDLEAKKLHRNPPGTGRAGTGPNRSVEKSYPGPARMKAARGPSGAAKTGPGRGIFGAGKSPGKGGKPGG